MGEQQYQRVRYVGEHSGSSISTPNGIVSRDDEILITVEEAEGYLAPRVGPDGERHDWEKVGQAISNPERVEAERQELAEQQNLSPEEFAEANPNLAHPIDDRLFTAESDPRGKALESAAARTAESVAPGPGAGGDEAIVMHDQDGDNGNGE